MTRTTRSSSKKTTEKVATKLTIKKSIKIEDKSSTKKAAKTPVTKKEIVKPKIGATTTKKSKLISKDLVPNLLELCLLLDCTGSMASWI